MEFLRYGPNGGERPAVRNEGTCFDLRPLTNDIDPRFIATDGLERTSTALARGELPAIDIDGVRLGPPIARPAAIICVGLNYAAHAAESGSEAPASPVIFLKHPGCVVGPDDDVVLPPGSLKTDWEVELAVVLGSGARYLSDHASALECVAGYTISNDVSEREYQLDRSGGQWSKGKCCPTFNPLGPFIVPAFEIPDPQNLKLATRVNGELRQLSTTADMIFGVAELIQHLSHHMVLEPGDVINTGTPEGVALSGRFPYLESGDVIEIEIDGLGQQRQRVTTAHRPTRER